MDELAGISHFLFMRTHILSVNHGRLVTNPKTFHVTVCFSKSVLYYYNNIIVFIRIIENFD